MARFSLLASPQAATLSASTVNSAAVSTAGNSIGNTTDGGATGGTTVGGILGNGGAATNASQNATASNSTNVNMGGSGGSGAIAAAAVEDEGAMVNGYLKCSLTNANLPRIENVSGHSLLYYRHKAAQKETCECEVVANPGSATRIPLPAQTDTSVRVRMEGAIRTCKLKPFTAPEPGN